MTSKNNVLAVILLTIAYGTPSLAAEFLDEKTAFCNTQKDLGEYLRFAKYRNIDGMNRLVISGNCNFVPDGEKLTLSEYQSEKIASVPVIAFEVEDDTRWTFKAFISTDNL